MKDRWVDRNSKLDSLLTNNLRDNPCMSLTLQATSIRIIIIILLFVHEAMYKQDRWQLLNRTDRAHYEQLQGRLKKTVAVSMALCSKPCQLCHNVNELKYIVSQKNFANLFCALCLSDFNKKYVNTYCNKRVTKLCKKCPLHLDM